MPAWNSSHCLACAQCTRCEQSQSVPSRSTTIHCLVICSPLLDQIYGLSHLSGGTLVDCALASQFLCDFLQQSDCVRIARLEEDLSPRPHPQRLSLHLAHNLAIWPLNPYRLTRNDSLHISAEIVFSHEIAMHSNGQKVACILKAHAGCKGNPLGVDRSLHPAAV